MKETTVKVEQKEGAKAGKNIRADLILLGCFLLAGLILFAVLMLNRKQGAVVEISVGGEVIETFSLSQDRTYTIIGKDGGHNDLVIQDGKAWLTDADCADQICMYMGQISHNNESIICLPHEVVIWVINEDEEQDASRVDATAGGAQ